MKRFRLQCRTVIYNEQSTDSKDEDKMAVASWSKFAALTDLLEYSLSDIADWLPRLVSVNSSTHKHLLCLLIMTEYDFFESINRIIFTGGNSRRSQARSCQI